MTSGPGAQRGRWKLLDSGSVLRSRPMSPWLGIQTEGVWLEKPEIGDIISREGAQEELSEGRCKLVL